MVHKIGGIVVLIVLVMTQSLAAQNYDTMTEATTDIEGHGVSPQEIGVLVTNELLSRATYMRYGRDGLHYAEACAAVGALRFAALMDDDETIQRLIDRYEVLLDDGSDLVSRNAHVDQSVIGIVPLQIYMTNGDERYLTQGLTFADRQWANPTEDGLTSETRWWIDDIYMIGMLQMQAYRATGKDVYADRTALELAAYLDRLQQDNGLFFHGSDAPFYWGRGNGWVAVGVAEVLSRCPPIMSSCPRSNHTTCA